MINRTNKFCSYYPCHEGLEDCSFCYCPFYPCLDKELGGYVYPKSKNSKVWSCTDCNFVHKKRVTDKIFRFIKDNRDNFLPNSKVVAPFMAPDKTGFIILAHGSKLKEPGQMMDAGIIKEIRKALRTAYVNAAYLQFSWPNLAESLKEIITKGCKRVIIVPFFLFMGNHVRRDIPKLIRQEMKKYPGVKFTCTKNIGTDARINDIVLLRIKEAFNK